MAQPNIKTRVVHSVTKSAWNVVGTTLGGKYKIARCPYNVSADDNITSIEREEAYRHACFISEAFNRAADAKGTMTIERFNEN